VHPVAFTIGGVTIHWYGIMLATGFMVGLWTAGRRGMRIGINPEDLSNLVIWIFVGGVAGAKILFVINHWNGEQPLKELILQRSGMVFHGALIGTSIAIWIFTRTKNMPLWATFDSLAPSFALGHAFGRIGCFMTGCCYGKVCSLPWAVQFPEGSLAFSKHDSFGLIESTASHSLHIHPTQIYECLLNFALYGALAWLFRKRKFDGQVFTAYLLGYAILRFGMEFLRDDGRGRMWFDSLTSGQGISILLLIGGGFLWWKLKERNQLQAVQEEA
jgi:phosphatidylglycerol:prolipoprotein diacylglycerol transferase